MWKRHLTFVSALLGISVLFAGPVCAAKSAANKTDSSIRSALSEKALGAKVYSQTCAACHTMGMGHAPAKYTLQQMPQSSIYRTLTIGAMKAYTPGLTDADKMAVAEYLGVKGQLVDKPLAPACKGVADEFDYNQPPLFPSRGITYSNTYHEPESVSGINAKNVGALKLKWVLAVPGGTRLRSQPALAGGAVYLGTENGNVYALDWKTGCVRWTFEAKAEVRTGLIVSPWKAGDKHAHPRVYFGDLVGNVYAVDATNGKLVWQARADKHGATTLTGGPVLYKGTLYVPVSSLEEGMSGPHYPCCTFRGSIVAYDAATGHRLWKTYLVDKPVKRGKTSVGTEIYGPSGAAVWNTPAIDAKRGLLYFGTGDNYTRPASNLSDAIVAISMDTGKIDWSYQATTGDAWNTACVSKNRSTCPKHHGGDFDIGASVVYTTTANGRDLVLAGQKSGWVYALDARTHKLVWKTKVGRGGVLGGVWFGMAVKGDTLFVPVSDLDLGHIYHKPGRPGLYALDLETGKYLWKAPNDENRCASKEPLCAPAIAAPPLVTDDVVFDGSDDGWLRAYASKSGKVIWRFDTAVGFKTAEGDEAKGGAIGGAEVPLIYHGRMLVQSGYGFAGQMPGNAILMFGTK